MPPRIFMRVDLPAPFSPASPTTSPALIPKSTLLSARTPPKRFSIPCNCRTGGFIGSPRLTPSQLVDLFGERFNAVTLDDQRRYEHLLARRDHRAVATQHLVH